METMLAEGQALQLVQGGEQEPPSQPCVLQDEGSSEPDPGLGGEAPGSRAHCGGPAPEKKTKGASRGSAPAKAQAKKTQQLLAAAALKDSQNIAHFFYQRDESPPPLSSAPGAESVGPSCEGVRAALAATPEKCTGEEDGALGHLAAHPQTECTREWTRKGHR
ncbi:PREDICTED: ATP-dependent DNA helicase Q5-like [Hipposideros armiger]|uniref:ATP-dependent DNA helicase Q5-like n=1 Tax=Hipposideros armiger TaxID=186990 RepID=A0A8B7RFF1_HIPAR|nr:PREDICTED: ATP-dependent DNA helicase Q5-like [Hipposideros armiger]